MRSEITADQNLRLAQKMLTQQGEINALKARIAAVLAEVDDTERRCRAQHWAECLCFDLATRIRTTLTGEDPSRE